MAVTTSTYRPADGPRRAIFLVADAASELPTVSVPEGALAYAKDTDELSTYSGSAWSAVGGGSGSTNLTYTASTRVLASSSGTDATLPLVTDTEAGLAPASGGGTSNFLRADGTWTSPGGGGLTHAQALARTLGA